MASRAGVHANLMAAPSDASGDDGQASPSRFGGGPRRAAKPPGRPWPIEAARPGPRSVRFTWPALMRRSSVLFVSFSVYSR